MKLTELDVEGYRSLVDVTLPLRPLNVMVGPNGSGKTTVLEIFELLRNAAQENLKGALENGGGINATLSRNTLKPSNRLKIKLDVNVEDKYITEPLTYCFELTPSGSSGYEIPFEELAWRRNPQATDPYYYIQVNYHGVRYKSPEDDGWIHPNWDYQHTELALAQVPRMYPEPEALRNSLAKTRKLGALDVGHRSVIRLPQSLTPTTSPGANGENLYSTLYNLRASHRDTYDRIIDTLNLAFPGFKYLEFPLVGAGQATMSWYQEELSGPLFPEELSEGTLRFLWLITVLLSPTPAPITLIDEPEVSLHPELLKILAGLLQDASMRTQLIVATHSADLIRWLQPDEVLTLDKVDGQTLFTWADSLNIDEWLEEYTLGELWLMGTVGGRP